MLLLGSYTTQSNRIIKKRKNIRNVLNMNYCCVSHLTDILQVLVGSKTVTNNSNPSKAEPSSSISGPSSASGDTERKKLPYDPARDSGGRADDPQT